MKNYPHIFNDTGIGTWKYNVQTGDIECNENWANILGYQLSELEPMTSKKWADLFHPKFIDKSEVLLKEHFEGNSNFYQCEIRLKHRQGHWVWIMAKGRLETRTPEGQPLLMVGTNQDITEKKNTESLLKKYQDLLDISNNVVKSGTWEIDFLKKETTWSDYTKKMLDVPKDFIPETENTLNFFPEGKNRVTILNAIKTAVYKGRKIDLELKVNTHTNIKKWVRIIGVPEFKNKSCIRLYGLIQDIDESKKIQEDTAIREEQFRQTFEHASIGMALVGLTGEWLTVNESVCKILGYSKKELYKTTFREITHPDDLEKDLTLLEELLLRKRESYHMEKRYFRKDGAIVWVNLSVSLVRNDMGEAIHFVSQLQNITEKKALIETMKDQNKRLINFAYIVSHNLRSHTGNISMLLAIMASEIPYFSENEFYENLKLASENLNETVQHLNDVVIINTKLYDNLESLNVHTYIENAIATVKGLTETSDVTIHNTTNKNIEVSAIPAYLDSIILNFITNAIKYRHPNRKSMIEVFSAIEDVYVVLNFKDNGLGIDLETYGEKLFGMYNTFHNQKDSRGIGLFITKNQVEALGGKIAVESQVNQGTTFRVFLKNATH
ncbi:PAS domain S-box protein [Aequorivita sp. Q41]|uniref:PAS domain-containing sensor histidine kinase n=1 Tax=Aequorivita sp. Q41 TaxID=3153300 RepID=UPI0032420CB1